MTGARNCFVLAYVDDLLFLGEEQIVNKLFKEIQQHLLLRPTGTMSPGNTVAFLGRNITNRGDHYEISLADDHTTTLLTKTNLQDSKPAPAPGTSALKTATADHEQALSAEEHAQYRRAVGKLPTDDIHTTRHQLRNKRTGKSIAAANNSRSTKAEAPSQVHQRNKAQADHPTNGEASSKSNP